MKEITGQLNAAGIKLGVVVSRFNSVVTEKLLEGASDVFRRSGGEAEDLVVLRVPGSFEIPQGANELAASGQVDAIVCLGCLIRGETAHYDYLATTVTDAIEQVALEHGLPVTFGVLTTNSPEEALNRAGLKHGNKGAEAASAAIEMAAVFRKVRESRKKK